MPTMMIPLSLLGLVPFVALGLAAVGQVTRTADLAMLGLVDYAALVLAFSGGVHWGLALLAGAVRPSLRAAAGILPLILAWVALMLGPLQPLATLGVLVLGYLATVLTEHRAAARFLVPSRYVWVRWVFTVVAVVMMMIVLILRGLGQTIVF